MRNRAACSATRLTLASLLALGTCHAWAAVTGDAPPPPPPEHHAHGKHTPKADAHGPAEAAGKPAPHTATAVPAPPPAPPQQADDSVKLPPFAALKFDDTNLRRGPGTRYPIDWVYKRRDLPLQIEGSYDIWRHVRDPDGVVGWVMSVQLAERRTFMVKDAEATLRADVADTARAVATLKPGVIGRIRSCEKGAAWCQVQVAGYKGYLRRNQLWGVLPDEELSSS